MDNKDNIDLIELVNDYKEKRAELTKAKGTFKESEGKIESIIENVCKKYYFKEKEVCKSHNIPIYTIYEYAIPEEGFDKFSIDKETEEYYLVNCSYTDRDEDTFHWKIEVPKDLSKLEEYLDKFADEIIQKHEDKLKKKEEDDKQKRYEKFLELQNEFKNNPMS